MRLALVLLLPLVLASCAGDEAPIPMAPPNVQKAPALKDTIPKTMLTCATEPDGSSVNSNAEASEYIVDLRSAGRDCRRKLKAVRGLIENEVR